MSNMGWIGEPVLTVGGPGARHAWNASHRLAVANELDMKVPAYRWEPTEAQANYLKTAGVNEIEYIPGTNEFKPRHRTYEAAWRIGEMARDPNIGADPVLLWHLEKGLLRAGDQKNFNTF
jgi:hypothetical protein